MVIYWKKTNVRPPEALLKRMFGLGGGVNHGGGDDLRDLVEIQHRVSIMPYLVVRYCKNQTLR